MGLQKIKDAAVKVREYTDNQGNKKGQWLNVGSIMRGDDGNEFLLLDRTFNSAGVPNPDGRGNVLISFFDVKDEDRRGQSRQSSGGQSRQSAASDMDDEIPF